MKNTFQVDPSGDFVTVWLKRKDGSVWGAKVDLEDLDVVASIPNTWYAMWDKDSQTFYAITIEKINGKQKATLMHRLITDAALGTEVDHGNHEGLDNRRLNLTVTDRSGNALNRRGANRNSKTGTHGIYLHSGTGKYRAWIRVDGKRKQVGVFSNLEAATEARVKYLEATA